MRKQKGFITLLAIIIGILLIGGGAYFYISSQSKKNVSGSALPGEINYQTCDPELIPCKDQDLCTLKTGLLNPESKKCDLIIDENIKRVCEDANNTFISIYDRDSEIKDLRQGEYIGKNILKEINELKNIINNQSSVINTKKEEIETEMETIRIEYKATLSEAEDFFDVLQLMNTSFITSDSDCKQISDLGAREICQILNNPNLTESTCNGFKESRGQCYFFLAQQEKNRAYCSYAEAPDGLSFADCDDLVTTRIAIDSTDASFCGQIDYKNTSSFERQFKFSTFATCVLQVVYKDDNPNQCKYLPEGGNDIESISNIDYFFKDGCEKMVWKDTYSSNKTDFSSLRQINSIDKCEEGDAVCINTFAIKLSRPDLCYEGTKDKCSEAVYALTGNKKHITSGDLAIQHFFLTGENLCSSVTDGKSNCFATIGKYKKDLLVCNQAKETARDDRYIYDNMDDVIDCYVTTSVSQDDPKICLLLDDEYPPKTFSNSKTQNCLEKYSLITGKLDGCMAIYQWDDYVFKKELDKKNDQLKVDNSDLLEDTDYNRKISKSKFIPDCSNNYYQTEKQVYDSGTTYGPYLDDESRDLLESKIDEEGAIALQTLEGLSCLNSIDIDYDGIENLTNLPNLPNLKKISASYSSDFKDLSGIERFPLLEELDISSTDVFDISKLKTLTNIKSLYIDGTKITNLEPLRNITSIKELYLNRLNYTDLSPIYNLDLESIYLDADVNSLDELSGIKTEKIDISVNIESEEDILKLNSIPAFEYIALDLELKSQFNDFSSLNVKNLKDLYLDFNGEFYEINIKSIYHLKELEDITIRDGKLSSIDLRKFPNLTNLTIYDTQLETLSKSIIGIDSDRLNISIDVEESFEDCINWKKENPELDLECIYY